MIAAAVPSVAEARKVRRVVIRNLGKKGLGMDYGLLGTDYGLLGTDDKRNP